ncbi:unnamed protein product [Porites evermanni]|uniref:BTB domain-containing protein n=1 Tax=Porites evermanni TaxID=104178 RepID=A0ABN8M1Q1_9CNID|nr:unnamed protein product [Porites evermanni]
MAYPTDSLDFSKPWQFSDVVLVVEEERFQVHRNILGMWSEVFTTMFTSEFKEKTARDVPLPGKKSSEIKEMLLVIYPTDEVSKLMGKGKRHLVCNEVVQAVKCFEEATQKLESQYGSKADECGEAYLFYGKALLELSRAENGVLGNALKDVEPKSEESSDEEEEKMDTVGPKIREMSPSTKDKIRENVQDAMADKEEGAGSEEKEMGDNESESMEVGDKGDEGSSKTEKEETKEGSESKSEKTTSKETNKESERKRVNESESMEVEDKGDEGSSKTEKEETKEESESKSEETTLKEAETADSTKEEKENKALKEKNDGQEDQKEEGEDDEEEGGEEGEDDDEGEEEEGEEGAKGDTDTADTEGQEEDGDIPTMQLAWESLIMAHLVFSRNENKEAQLNLAEVHLKLGEIQLEQEQFAGAIEDFKKCLELQEKHLESDDRLIAETAYNLGLGYSLLPNYSKSKEFYSKALSIIQLRTTKIEARLAESDAKSKGKGKANENDPCVVDRKELEELQNLSPEIKARVDDAQEMMNAAASQQAETTTEEGFGSSGLQKSDLPVNTIQVKKVSAGAPVTDVSHLVRRKRKPEEESSITEKEETEAPVKKARQDEEQVAQPTPAVTENGHAKN